MSFSSRLACSVHDDDFPERAQIAFSGSLDEVSEDGIMLRRSAESIIFKEVPPPPDPATEAADAPALPAPIEAGADAASQAMAAAEKAVDSDAAPSADEPFAPDPALQQALGAMGLSGEESSSLEEMAREALEMLSFNRALFSCHDFDKAVAKKGAAARVSSSAWPSMREALIQTLQLVNLTPELGISRNAMFALASFIKIEDEMIEFAKRETDEHAIPAELVSEVLDSKPTMAEEQRVAAIASCSGNKAVVVTEGTAGAGKSFTLNAIREVYEKAPPDSPGGEVGYDIIGTALSWTATKVLEESAGLSGGRAIQGLTMAMEEAASSGGDFFKRRTILIVDEAGLVGVKHMHKILTYAAKSRHPVRVLLTGDSLQLCPVEAGNALEAIVDECGSSRLDTIRRQKQASHRAAVKHFCYGRSENALWTYWQQEAIHFCANAGERRELVMRDYVRYCVSNPEDVALVLALENAEVKLLNSEIRERLKLVGRLVGPEHAITVTDGRSAYSANFCVGDQVVLRKNKVDHPVFKSRFEKIFHGAAAAQRRGETQASIGSFNRWISQWKREKALNPAEEPEELRQGVFNRTTGLLIDIKKNPDEAGAFLLRILLNEGGEIEIDTAKYVDEKMGAVPLHHNFATTIYASQGQTVQKVLIMDSPYMNRRLAYVGMSRHTMMCDIYADCQEIDARVAKDGARQVDRAWTRFEKDTYAEKGPEERRLAKLRAVISEWSPSNGSTPKAKDYLKAMAASWNQDSANPTVLIAKKQLSRRRKAEAPGGNGGFPFLCSEDDPDDHLEPRLPEPYLFEDLQTSAESQASASKGFFSTLAAKRKPQAEAEPVDEVLRPLVLNDGRESCELPEWGIAGAAKEAFDAGRGVFWAPNRYGFPRIFSLDPRSARPCSRWSMDGALKSGDGEVIVLANDRAPEGAPWMVVAGPREALISFGHYRSQYKDDPSKIPNIVAAPPACDLSTLAKWLPPGVATLHCAWSPKNPETLAGAQALYRALRALGHAAAVHPPAPQPASPARTPSRPR